MSEQMITLSDAQAAEFGFTAPAPASTESAKVEETKTEVPTPNVSEALTPPAVEKTPESGVTPKTEAGPTESGKTLYTPEEIEKILMTDGVLDSSRLDANGKILQKSFQRGTTQKFEQAKREREEATKIRADAEAKLADFERKQREIENKKIFDKEVEELGEADALRNKELREIREEQRQLRWERDQARQRELSMQIGNEYRQVAPKYFIPGEQVYEDIALANKWTTDIRRAQQGLDPITMDEANQTFADAIGLTNFDNLLKLAKANPENYKALKNLFINEYNIEKSKGPTISPATSANVQAEKKPAGEVDPNKSTMDLVREALGLSAGEEIRLT